MPASKAVRLVTCMFCLLGCLSVFGLWKIGELAFQRLSPRQRFRIQQAQARIIKQTGAGNLVTPTPPKVRSPSGDDNVPFLYAMQWRAPNTALAPGATRRPNEICYDYFPEPWSSTDTVAPEQLWKRLWCLHGGREAVRSDDGDVIRVSHTAEPGLMLRSWSVQPERGEPPALRLKALAEAPRGIAVICQHAQDQTTIGHWTVQLGPDWNEWFLASAAPTQPIVFAIDVGMHAAAVEFAALELGAVAFQASPWRLPPHVIQRRYNAHADRDRDYPDTPPPAALRIVCVGDSFTEGAGVRAEETFAKQLEAELTVSEEGPIEVLNCGANLANPADYTDKFLRHDVLRGPHAVIVTLCRNDYETPTLRKQLQDEHGADYEARYRVEQKYALSVGYRPALNDLDPLLERCRQDDIPVVLCAFQTDRAAESFRMDEDAAQFARERNLPYYNPAQDLIAADLFDERAKCSPYEWHPNREVHRRLASELARLLREQGVLAAARERVAAAAQ